MRHPSIALVITVMSAGGAAMGCGSSDVMMAGAAAPGTTGEASAASGSTAAQMPSTASKPTVTTPSSSASARPGTGAPAAMSGATAAMSGMPATSVSTVAASAGAPAANSGVAAASAGAPAASGGMQAGSAGAPASTGSPMGGTGVCGPAPTIPAAMLGDQAEMVNGAPAFKNLGPFKPMHIEGTGPTGASWVFFPENFGTDGMKHPVFLWGPGAGTGPSNYQGYLNLFASYGIVTICQPSTNSGTQALDWILKENETTGSMFFGKLDPDRVGRGGHSMGALLSMSEAKDDRLKATVLVCGGAGGGGGAADITYPSIFLGATGEGGTQNFQGDYAEVKGPSIFVTAKMSDHVACGRDNMSPWLAFLRWRLCDEEALWKKEFMAGGTFCTGKWEACMDKNF